MIKEGKQLPEVKFHVLGKKPDGSKSEPHEIGWSEVFRGKKGILVGIPGAFTPICSSSHLPAFIDAADDLKEKKHYDFIACTGVNDAYVMEAWKETLHGDGKVTMLADEEGKFAESIGALDDFHDKALGMRSKRYAMIVDDGVVRYVGCEQDDFGKPTSSSLEAVMNAA